MANYYKRYIYKNGVKHGPYYYSNKKVNGKVISTYLGTKPPKSEEFSKPSKTSYKLLIIILSIISLALLVNLSIKLELFTTGKVPVQEEEIDLIPREISQKQIEKTDKTGGITGTVPGEEVGIMNKTNETTIQVEKEKAVVKTTQSSAAINKPVRWIKEVSLENQGSVRVEIPKDAEVLAVFKVDEQGGKEKVSDSNIRITAQVSSEIVLDSEKEPAIISFFRKIIAFFTGNVVSVQESGQGKEILVNENGKNYEIVYETPAPTTTEEGTESGKTIIVSSPEPIIYENVLTFTSLDESLNVKDPEKVKIYWVEASSYISPEKVEDTNSNGIYDYVEFIAPSSDNQTFEIIVITKAEHLDENRTFVSDIYDEVKVLDDIFSEEIPDMHYIRVTFEKNLTSENDITIFPKIARENPKIEVYEKDKDVLLAEFSFLVDNEYNQVLLTNLEGEQDTFDLRVVGGSVFFDHIVDPLVTLFYDTFTGTTGTLLTSHPPNIGISWIQAWTSGGNLDIESNQLQHTGTTSDGGIGIANPAPSGNNYSVSVLYAVADSQDDTSTLVLRWADVNNFYSFRWSTTASQSLINKRVAGTCTVLNSLCPSPSQGQIVRFEVIGSTLSVYYNNALACSAIDTSLASAGRGGTGVGATPCDTNNDVSVQRLDNFNMTEIVPDTDPPIISNPNINTTSITINEYFCLNATVLDLSGISQVYAEVWNTTSWLNYTMTETGGSCSGTGSDGVYGISVQGTAIGVWNYSKVYANDSLNNLGILDFSDLTINVNTIPNSPPTIPYIQQPLSEIPIDSEVRNVAFEVRVSDSNGVDDINDSNVKVNFTKSGEPTRYGVCTWSTDIDVNTANYSCSVGMQFYDLDGIWNISVNATDSSNALSVNNTAIFTYGLLKSITLNSPIGSLNWPILNQSSTDVLSNNDPSIMENIGNYEGAINITAYDLAGETNPLQTIPASSFRAGPLSVTPCSETQLQNTVSKAIIGTYLARGSGATESIFYCITSIPNVQSQNYSSQGANAWVIGI